MQGFRTEISAIESDDDEWPPPDADYFNVISPIGPFVVDGITYDNADPGCTSRLMIELLEDHDGAGVRMRADKPLTEDEVEQWLRHGRWGYRAA